MKLAHLQLQLFNKSILVFEPIVSLLKFRGDAVISVQHTTSDILRSLAYLKKGSKYVAVGLLTTHHRLGPNNCLSNKVIYVPICDFSAFKIGGEGK